MTETPFTYPEGCYFSTIESIKNKKITIMGLGLNGGGEASVRFFLQHGAFVTVTDMKTAEQLKPTIDRLTKDSSLDTTRLTFRLGEHKLEDFSNADCVIKNPGVKISGNKYLAAAKAIETDISIFLYFSKAPLIAVTGSKGKSSTVSAIHYGLCQAGFTSFLGGNITVSPLTFLDKTNKDTPVVLELSSWQLADLRGRKTLKPHIAVITKIVPDHQNWYGNMESYVADKRLLYKNQTEQDYTILDADGDEKGTGPSSGETWGNLFAKESKATILRYSKNKLSEGTFGVWQENKDGKFFGKMRIANNEEKTILTHLSVPGNHMKTNVLNAALVLSLMNVPSEKISEILGSWQGIEHRLQYFYKWQAENSKNTFTFYNDSCSTVPESAAAASQAFEKPIIFITGGTDKGLGFDLLAKTLLCKEPQAIPVKDLYLLAGTGTDKLLALLDNSNIKFNGPFNSLQELLQALKANITNLTQENESIPIVFSPGATSFGMFTNEFDRGNKFMNTVKDLFC